MNFAKDDNFEVYVVKLPFPSGNICTPAIYRALSGNFLHFLNGLDAILNALYNTNSKFIICGDINVNYLVDNNRKNN
jgi:exonuclease III